MDIPLRNNTNEQLTRPIEEDKRDWKPKVLVISCGGVKGFGYLGALFLLGEREMLDQVTIFCGVSIGSVISLLLTCGLTVRQIVKEVATEDLFQDLTSLSLSSITNSYRNFGLISNDIIKRKLLSLIEGKMGMIPTLRELYHLTGKVYVSVALNTTDEKTEYYSMYTTPDMSCVDAALYSMNIPFLFYQLTRGGKVIVDGALANTYPVDYFDNGSVPVLGIHIQSNKIVPKKIVTIVSNSTTSNTDPIDTAKVYLTKIVKSTLEQRKLDIVSRSSAAVKHLPITIDCEETISTAITISDKMKMVSQGYNSASTFLSTIGKKTSRINPPKFDYSVMDDNFHSNEQVPIPAGGSSEHRGHTDEVSSTPDETGTKSDNKPI